MIRRGPVLDLVDELLRRYYSVVRQFGRYGDRCCCGILRVCVCVCGVATVMYSWYVDRCVWYSSSSTSTSRVRSERQSVRVRGKVWSGYSCSCSLLLLPLVPLYYSFRFNFPVLFVFFFPPSSLLLVSTIIGITIIPTTLVNCD